jgi:acetyltransferase-like isoleucine patch superfamily enzyme
MKTATITFILGFIDVLLKFISRLPSQTLRLFLLRHLFRAKLGGGTVIYGGFEIRMPWKLSIKGNSIIGHGAVLDARAELEIGENVNLSSEVMIWTQQHDYRCPLFGVQSKKVVIEDYAWLGPRSIILPGVVVGEGAVVAAGAVVTKNVDPYTLVGGIPAKQIGTRPTEMKYQLGKNYLPFT